MKNSQEYVVENVTAMSTMDGYFWLKMARELDEGSLGKGKPDPTKGYPDLVPLAIKDTPSLLAEFISFGRRFTGGDYYRSGLLLIPILAGLFIFPLFYYFNRLGFGASAVLGGLIGSFSHAYYARTMMGRVDTDLLNTFFPLAVACFVLPMSREKSLRANIGLAVGAGLTMYLFTWWYQQPGIILVYLFCMLFYLLLGRVPWRLIIPVLLVFLLASGIGNVLQSMESVRTFLWAYVSPPPTGRIAWPDVLQTITEAKHGSLASIIKKLHGFLPFLVAGFGGMLYLYFSRFRQMIPITPMVLLGGWSLLGPNRFAMYLAPFIGIGSGVVIQLCLQYAGERFRLSSFSVYAAGISLMFILFFSTTAYTGYDYHIPPSLSASTTRAILDIKGLVPKHSAMFTPFWEYGYALMQIGDFATYHDGGLQGGMRTTLAAKAMTSSRQEEMVSMLSFLEDYGFRDLSSRLWKQKLSSEEMMDLMFKYPGNFRGENVYVLYLEPMLWKIDNLSYFGTWDFEAKKSEKLNYVKLNCVPANNNMLICADGTIDLEKGIINDGKMDIPLRSSFVISNGYVKEKMEYPHDVGYYLEIVMNKGEIHEILVADEKLFNTNFNQQFLLGNYDPKYFEEIYNNFPVARVLKVKTARPPVVSDRVAPR